MGWLPDDPEDAFWFAIAPLTTIPTAVYSMAAMTTGDWRYGKPDWRANVRNAAIWSTWGATAYGWNLMMSPHNAQYLSGTNAMKNALHLAAIPSVVLPALAVGSAAGWVATAEHHGAVTPGVASGIGMPMSLELYSGGTADNPAGWDLRQWWSDLF